MVSYKKWSINEIEYLKEFYSKKSLHDLSKTLNRSKDSVFKKAQRLGITNKLNHWTLEEEGELSEFWGVFTVNEIGKTLNRTEISVKKKAIELGLGPSRIGNGQFLTTGDIGYLLNKNPNLVYRLIRDGYIKGKRFGKKGIFQVKPKYFILFLKEFPHKWNSQNARTDLIKGYLHKSFNIPQWFSDKIEYDRNLSKNNNYKSKNIS